VVREQVQLPPGYTVLWSGQFESMARVCVRLAYIIPSTLDFKIKLRPAELDASRLLNEVT
jgi:Cu/Ag efflux pump CusA